MHAPSFEAIFAVMAAVSEGNGAARVELPEALQLDDTATRLAIALNMLLDDVAFGVAEQRKVEERLRQSQKMEAIGNLAGGIAHDFNNMLFVILGFTDVVLEQLDPEGSTHADLVQVKLAAERARDLTRQLLTFSRRQVHQPRSLDPFYGINLLFPNPFPSKVFAHVEPARQWLVAELRGRGIHLPGDT